MLARAQGALEHLELRAAADDRPPLERDRHTSQHDSPAPGQTIADGGHPERCRTSGGHDGRLEPGHDPDDAIGQVAGDAQPVQGGGQVGSGALEMGTADAQAAVAADHGSPVALGAAQRLPQDRHHVLAVPGTDGESVTSIAKGLTYKTASGQERTVSRRALYNAFKAYDAERSETP